MHNLGKIQIQSKIIKPSSIVDHGVRNYWKKFIASSECASICSTRIYQRKDYCKWNIFKLNHCNFQKSSGIVNFELCTDISSHLYPIKTSLSRSYAAEVISKSKLLDYISQGKMKSGAKLLLDVRTPEEYLRGTIPDAKNLPLQRLENALEMSPEERIREFGFDIFDWKEKEIVVFCQAGIRSRRAQIILEEKGFKLIENYEGSYSDWQSP